MICASATTWLSELHRLHGLHYSDARIAAILSDLFAPRKFTRRMVFYYRCEQERDRDDDQMRPIDRLTALRSSYQAQRGFAHLLPEIVLRQREADILALLRREGPLTRPEIARALGAHSLRTRGHGWMGRLYRAGLVGRRGHPPDRVRYILVPFVLPPVASDIFG